MLGLSRLLLWLGLWLTKPAFRRSLAHERIPHRLFPGRVDLTVSDLGPVRLGHACYRGSRHKGFGCLDSCRRMVTVVKIAIVVAELVLPHETVQVFFADRVIDALMPRFTMEKKPAIVLLCTSPPHVLTLERATLNTVGQCGCRIRLSRRSARPAKPLQSPGAPKRTRLSAGSLSLK